MSHNHHHDHDIESNTDFDKVKIPLIIGISLNFLFVVIEVIAAFIVNPVSLLSDAGHNLADVGALGLSLLAIGLLKVKSNKKYTYGYKKASVIFALFNAIVLLLSIGAISYEAILRLIQPETVKGLAISVIAGIGIVINASTGLLLIRHKNKDLNIKASFSHLMSDAVVSAGLVLAGIIMFYTNWFWLDSVFSFVITIIIMIGTWSLLKESMRLSFDGVPKDINLADIEETASSLSGIKEIHHIHVWAISTQENALTAHIVLADDTSVEDEKNIKQELKHLFEHKNIQHVTLETERENAPCETIPC